MGEGTAGGPGVMVQGQDAEGDFPAVLPRSRRAALNGVQPGSIAGGWHRIRAPGREVGASAVHGNARTGQRRQPLDYLLGKVCEMVWEAVSSAQSELEPYLVPLRNYLGALIAKAGRTPARDFALGVLTERVRQEEDGWPDQPGTEQERAGRRQAHGHPSSHLCLLERKHQVEAAIYATEEPT